MSEFDDNEEKWALIKTKLDHAIKHNSRLNQLSEELKNSPSRELTFDEEIVLTEEIKQLCKYAIMVGNNPL